MANPSAATAPQPAISVVVEDRLYLRSLQMIAVAPKPQHYLLAGFVGQLVGLPLAAVLKDLEILMEQPIEDRRRSQR